VALRPRLAAGLLLYRTPLLYPRWERTDICNPVRYPPVRRNIIEVVIRQTIVWSVTK
jgi:hypothetical protein